MTRTRSYRSKTALLVATAVGMLLASSTAQAKVYQLRAASKQLTMPDGASILMWGFGLASETEVSIPGPMLEVPPGDTTLTIELTNELPVPVSIVIPSLPAPLTPVWDDGSSGARANLAQRAVSLTHVAASGGTATYQWTNVQPGTYLYQSGTHAAVQVQMGLYGAVKHDAAGGTAYPGVTYDAEVTLLYSAIDPALHAAVAAGTYGTPAYSSTVNYHPRYFLINGQPFSGQPPIAAGNVGDRVLLRVLNAGLQTIVPTINGDYLRLLAEDGQPHPFAAERYSMLLPAGKTRDAIWTPTAEGTTALFDRSLRLAGSAAGGGVIARLEVAAPQGGLVALDDAYTVDEDGAIDTVQDVLDGVLDNDTGTGTLNAVLVTDVSAGTLALQPDGSFTYAPAADFSGTDTFAYYASDGTTNSSLATVTIAVNPVNDAPVAVNDAYQASEGVPLLIGAPGVMTNDTDVDGDAPQAEIVLPPTGGSVTLSPSGALEYIATTGTTTDSFSYRTFDGAAYSNVATVSVAVVPAANLPPIAEEDFARTTRNVPVTINVVGNDHDPDGTIAPSTVLVVDTPTRGGTVSNAQDGSLVFTPKRNFKGTDTFTYLVADDQGLQSAPATVRVNVVR